MSEDKKFTYGGKKYWIEVPWSGSSRISVRAYCAHHPDYSMSLGSVRHKRRGLGKALLREIKRGQRTRKKCHDCKQVDGILDRAYAELSPLLMDEEREAK